MVKRSAVLATIIGSLAFIATVAIVGIFTQRDAQRKKDQEFTSLVDSTVFPRANPRLIKELIDAGAYSQDFTGNQFTNYTYILIKAALTGVDPTLGTYRIQLTFSPCGDFVDLEKLAVGRSGVLATPLSISFDSKMYRFPAGSPMNSQEFSAPFESGDVNNYPLDRYVAKEIFITGEFYNQFANATQPVPILVIFKAPILTFAVTVDTLKDLTEPIPTGSFIQLDFSATRTATNIFFSCFVMIIMWALSLLAFTMGSTLWMRARKVEGGVISITMGLIFSLPGIRNTQPGSPPIGCNADVMSFFWAMLLAACTASMLLVNYIMTSIFDIELKKAVVVKPIEKMDPVAAPASPRVNPV
ncbi:hypothetical protein BC829DRAFT_432996 [Chytridium lagenaria]|nr:hypothetical protein BC829DRAFT_432996 [Chytridium lagenaria]